MNFKFSLLFSSVAISLILSISCSRHQSHIDQKVQARPFSDTLRSNAIPLERATPSQPFRIINLDNDYLIITKLKKNDFISVYKLPGLQFLYNWGRHGNGNNRFKDMVTEFIPKAGDRLIMYDASLDELRTYKVGNFALKKISEQSLSYHNQKEPLDNLKRVNDNLYFSTYGMMNVNTNYEYVALRPGNNDILFLFGQYPATDLKRRKRFNLFYKTNVIKPNGSKFAAFYIHYNKFKLFNTKGKLLKIIHVHDSSINDKNTIHFTYRWSEYASNKYIYAIGVYATSKQLRNSEVSSFKTTLEVWNWKGKQVYRAKFDRPIQIFTVSEKYHALYGIARGIGDSVFVYKLPKVLDFQ